MKNLISSMLTWVAISILTSTVTATALSAPVDFTREVQPILSEHCAHCHGSDEKSRKGGLRLDVREAALKGGESDSPAIVPGKPGASAIIARVLSHDSDEVMPPPKEKKPVSEAQADILKRWIAEGANYAKHWAFEAPVKVRPGDEEMERRGENAIDAFVKAKLEAMKLQPSPRAEAATLCRRLYLDLVGLPPSPAEVAEFVQASAKDAKAATTSLVEKLMKSPHFGEKWARHWLDAARYSDSNGYEKDLPREQWAWRDWVINAFNQDLPYDQFLIEQLAGDLLPNATQDQIVATGFLRNSMVNEEGAIVAEQFRMDELFDRMDCIGKATLGLSLQCAQCHTHKFDPITHDEYFGIFAFFNNAYEAQSWVYTPEQQKQIAQIKSAVQAAEERLKKQRPQWKQEMATWDKSVKAKEVAWKPLKATELESTSGLNHPTQEPDLSILTQGHPTTKGDIYGVFEADLKGVTALRLEALTHRDLPFNGPGRSKYGTWAVSEMVVTYQLPDSDKWEPLKLVNATADFSEPDARLEEEWKADFDKQQKRVRGPVSYLIDGNDDTGWRADRGAGLRNQESVAVVQFEKPLDLPANTKLKVLLRYHHSGGGNGRDNTMLGRCRVSTTTAPTPQAQPVDYASLLAMQTAPEKRTPEQQHAIFTAWRKTVKEAKAINDQIAAEWKKQPPAMTSVLHLAERKGDNARATKLLDRGAWDRPKHVVAPHTPVALHPLEKSDKMDRLAFARWLADKRSALTARVAVNRVWQAIFGSGLVETSEDFGTRAAAPEYRELLDWLAVDFMEHGWSHKHLIQTILASATYQQSSKATPASLERDPRNRYLARGPRFRMEAEAVRDNALSIAGLLHKQVGGPSIFPPVPQSMLDYNFFKVGYWVPPTGPDRYRRALYVFRKRSMPDPVMSSFDAPNGDLACARRPRSNTPLSALTGLNETIFVEAAQALAQRILREGGTDDAARANYAYQLCTSRGIKPAELQSVLKLLEANRTRLRQGELKAGLIAFSSLTKPEELPVDATPNDIAVWTIVSRVLLNLDETMTKF
jgi:mono/diheme cytochrome c family protein